MATFKARYEGTCAGCGGQIHKGNLIDWRRGGGTYHAGCRPSADRRGDQQYWQGRRDVDNWHENQRLFGAEVAERMEIERELREGWEY